MEPPRPHPVQKLRNAITAAGREAMQMKQRRLDPLVRFGTAATISGTVASFTTTAALVLLAKAEGKGALQPTNATSHWLHGEEAGRVRRADAAHTAVGYGTHHASALFWALPFEMWLWARPPKTPLMLLRDASVMAAIAATVDYGLVPKRLTPGWELALSKRSVAATFAAMAAGLAVGAILTQGLRPTSGKPVGFRRERELVRGPVGERHARPVTTGRSDRDRRLDARVG